jgi:uncharacterized protein (TIGR03089 family)
VPTFTDVLDQRLRRDPGRPLVTFYDHASGERTELSVATYANWVAKTASLLAEELDLERGDRLLVDLPPHWLGPVVLGAAWTVGLEVVWPGTAGADDADAVVCGPQSLPHHAERADEVTVLASALLPLGVRFPDGVPHGVHDLGVEVWSQPDSFVAWDPPTGDDPAVAGTSQGELWEAAAAGARPHGVRLLTEANPASPSGLASFTEPLALAGSLVLVAHPDPERLDATLDAERATARFP